MAAIVIQRDISSSYTPNTMLIARLLRYNMNTLVYALCTGITITYGDDEGAVKCRTVQDTKCEVAEYLIGHFPLYSG